MEDKPTSGRWRGFITRRNAKRKTEREQEGSNIVQAAIVLMFVCGLFAVFIPLQGTIEDIIGQTGDKITSTLSDSPSGGGGGGGGVETPDDDPIETVGTLSKSRFQTYMGENQNATELTFDAVSYDGMAYTDVSEEQNGSILAFMDGDTMHVTAANGGKVGMPADCDSLFYGYLPNATAFNMSNCDTSSVMEMRGMFYGCYSLVDIYGLEDWNTSNVTSMRDVFVSCGALQFLGLNNWDTSNVTDMGYMFEWCHSLESVDLSNWDTSNVTDMSAMFEGCTSLQSLDPSGWDTSNVSNMGGMFNTCTSLTSLNLSGWDTSNVTDMCGMFNWCQSLTEIKVGDGWDISNADTTNMFEDCGTDHVIHV